MSAEERSGAKHPLGRRAFVRRALSALGWYSGGVATRVVQDPAVKAIKGIVHERLGGNLPGLALAHKRLDLIAPLFLTLDQNTNIIPPQNWIEPPNVDVAEEVRTYGHEFHVLRTVRGIVPATSWEVKQTTWPSDPNWSTILVGSAASNVATSAWLGRPGDPLFEVDRGSGEVIGLHYAMASRPESVLRMQYGREVRTRASGLKDRDGRTVALPDTDSQGTLHDDLLLVTRLPGRRLGTDVVIWAGLHGPGTRAVELLLTCIDPSELQLVADRIGFESRRRFYFQAVFRAYGFKVVDGSTIATRIAVDWDCPPKRLSVSKR